MSKVEVEDIPEIQKANGGVMTAKSECVLEKVEEKEVVVESVENIVEDVTVESTSDDKVKSEEITKEETRKPEMDDDAIAECGEAIKMEKEQEEASYADKLKDSESEKVDLDMEMEHDVQTKEEIAIETIFAYLGAEADKMRDGEVGQLKAASMGYTELMLKFRDDLSEVAYDYLNWIGTYSFNMLSYEKKYMDSWNKYRLAFYLNGKLQKTANYFGYNGIRCKVVNGKIAVTELKFTSNLEPGKPVFSEFFDELYREYIFGVDSKSFKMQKDVDFDGYRFKVSGMTFLYPSCWKDRLLDVLLKEVIKVERVPPNKDIDLALMTVKTANEYYRACEFIIDGGKKGKKSQKYANQKQMEFMDGEEQEFKRVGAKGKQVQQPKKFEKKNEYKLQRGNPPREEKKIERVPTVNRVQNQMKDTGVNIYFIDVTTGFGINTMPLENTEMVNTNLVKAIKDCPYINDSVKTELKKNAYYKKVNKEAKKKMYTAPNFNSLTNAVSEWCMQEKTFEFKDEKIEFFDTMAKSNDHKTPAIRTKLALSNLLSFINTKIGFDTLAAEGVEKIVVTRKNDLTESFVIPISTSAAESESPKVLKLNQVMRMARTRYGFQTRVTPMRKPLTRVLLKHKEEEILKKMNVDGREVHCINGTWFIRGDDPRVSMLIGYIKAAFKLQHEGLFFIIEKCDSIEVTEPMTTEVLASGDDSIDMLLQMRADMLKRKEKEEKTEVVNMQVTETINADIIHEFDEYKIQTQKMKLKIKQIVEMAQDADDIEFMRSCFGVIKQTLE